VGYIVLKLNPGSSSFCLARAPFVRITLVSISLVAPWASQARELQELYRGARQMAMGNAFVAIADDEAAIFMNPAGLAGIKNTTFNYGVFDLQVSSETISAISDSIDAFSNFSSDSFNVIMGKDIYGRVQIAPSLVTENLGVALLVDQQIGLAAENPSIPAIDFLYQTTNGVQVAYGTSVLGHSRKKAVHDLRLGMAAKILWRRGGVRRVPMIDLLTADSSTIGQLAGNFGQGYGFDLGAQYLRKINDRFKVMAGVAWTDIGDIEFGTSGADPQLQNLSAGIASTFGFNFAELTLAFDQRHILNDTDWRKRTHLGAQLDLPIFDLYAGVNQTTITYGASFDLWLIRMTAARYTEEVGAFAGTDQVGRWMLRLALKIPL